MQSLQEIAEVIKGLKSAVIFTHTRPDGDCLGSGLALYFALKQLNIPCEICNDSDIPDKFSFVFGISEIKKTPTMDADGYICVDSADEKRLGCLEEALQRAMRNKKITVNIDHHISNTKYAKYNFVRAMSSNCQNMTELMLLLGVTIDERIATPLFMGMLTDSGGFSHSDVNGDTFRAAGRVVDAGVNVDAVNYTLFKRQSKARAALYGETMFKIRYLLDDRLAVICITREMLQKYGAEQSMTEGFVDFPLTVEGVEVAAAILENKFRQYKISLRSKGRVNVNAIASAYGGGGHILASGCMIFGDLEEVVDKLRYTVSQYLD